MGDVNMYKEVSKGRKDDAGFIELGEGGKEETQGGWQRMAGVVPPPGESQHRGHGRAAPQPSNT